VSNYDGRVKVPSTPEYRREKPFYYEGITFDEYLVEWYYFGSCNTPDKMINYKTLRKQLEDGDIKSIPDSYKILCPFPENCTAFEDLIKP